MDGVALIEVLRLLHIPPHKRTSRDVQAIMQYTAPVKFFADQDSTIHQSCCQLMKYAEFPAGAYIFKVGDPGDSFCIILKGRVSVQIPTSRLSSDELKQMRKSENETKTAAFENNRRIFLHTKKWLGMSIVKKAVEVALEDEHLFQDPTAMTNTESMVAVSQMCAGSYFGELALLQGLPRSASIQCLEHTILAVLGKDNFNLVLKEHEAQKLNWKISFLLSIPMFATWSRQAVSKITYYLKERRYNRLEKVYEEGMPANEVFIVIDGEFKLTKTCQMQKDGLRNMKTLSRKTQLQVVIKGEKEMFGELDLLSDQTRSMNCTCVSSTGRLWAIAKFVREM